eukprot:c8777_g1_i1.p1 GENE.c8777_g1_i1~~c8777_g1_i1.p1  ORF type:complete len:640 (-),score=145.71 c8777_g1_i1:76-1716(-)
MVAKAQAEAEARGLTTSALMEKAQTINTNKVRQLVLGERAGMAKDDIVEISEQIVSMRLPVTKLEQMYRNPLEEIIAYLEAQYGLEHIKVFSLARNPLLDPAQFNNQVAEFVLPDTFVLSISTIHQLCTSASNWMNQDKRNLVVVQCSDGISGSGFIIGCLLLYLSRAESADQALVAYSLIRSPHSDGLAPYLPSQIRYARYYLEALSRQIAVKPPAPEIFLESITLSPVYGVTHPGVRIAVSETVLGEVRPDNSFLSEEAPLTLPLRFVGVSGDVRIDVINMGVIFDQSLFHFYFHTFFECPEAPQSDPSQSHTLVLSKGYLDGASKDVDCRRFPPDFRMELKYRTSLPSPEELQAMRQQARAHKEIEPVLSFEEEEELPSLIEAEVVAATLVESEDLVENESQPQPEPAALPETIQQAVVESSQEPAQPEPQDLPKIKEQEEDVRQEVAVTQTSPLVVEPPAPLPQQPAAPVHSAIPPTIDLPTFDPAPQLKVEPQLREVKGWDESDLDGLLEGVDLQEVGNLDLGEELGEIDDIDAIINEVLS